MKRQIISLLLILAFVFASGCGKTTPAEKGSSGETKTSETKAKETKAPESTEPRDTEDKDKDTSAVPGDGYVWPTDMEITYESNGPDVIALHRMLATSPKAEIPDSVDGIKVTSLYQFGIRNGEYLDEIVIPEGVETILDTDFGNCINLKRITIPASVTEISNHQNQMDDEFWISMAHVEDVVIAQGNSIYERDGGIIYRRNKDDSRTLVWYCRSNPEESYTLPDGLTIGEGAFACTDYLKELNTSMFPSTLIESSIEVINYAPSKNYGVCVNIYSSEHTALREVNIAGVFADDLHNSGLIDAINLERVNIAENKKSVSIDGVVYSLNDQGEPDTLTLYPPARPGEFYEVPDTVKKIRDGAFSGDELPYLKTISVKRGCDTSKAKLKKLEVI